MLCGAEGCDLPTKSLWARRCVVPHTCRAYSTSCARARPVTICTRYPGIIGLAVSSETEDSPDSTPPARPLRSMQTGQNSIAPENSLPQLGQVRWGSMLMILTALQPTEKARSHERPETPAARRLAYLLSRCMSNRDSRDRWRNNEKSSYSSFSMSSALQNSFVVPELQAVLPGPGCDGRRYRNSTTKPPHTSNGDLRMLLIALNQSLNEPLTQCTKPVNILLSAASDCLPCRCFCRYRS